MAARNATRWYLRFAALATKGVARLQDAVAAKKPKAERIQRLFEWNHRQRDQMQDLQEQAWQTSTEGGGVVYVIYDQSYKFYIGSTERSPIKRWEEHSRNFAKREAFRSSRALYFIALRAGPVDAMRLVERFLISNFQPHLNQVHNTHDAPMRLPKEFLVEIPDADDLLSSAMLGAKKNRRRPPKHQRKAEREKEREKAEAVTTKHILSLRNSRRHQVRQEVRAADFHQAYRMSAKKVVAPINVYEPDNYTLLAKWLTIMDGRKKERPHDLDLLSLRLHARGKTMFPEYDILRVVSHNLANLQRARARRKVKFAMDIAGLPTCERGRLYFRYDFERRALAKAFGSAFYIVRCGQEVLVLG